MAGGVLDLSDQEQLLEKNAPIRISQQSGSRPFGMGHQAKYISVLIADTGNIPGASVNVGQGRYLSGFITIFSEYVSIGFQIIQCFIICIITSFPVSNGNFQRPGIIPGQVHVFADELLVGIAQQNARQ